MSVVMSVAGDVSVAWHIWRGCIYRIFEASGCGEWPMTDTEELGPHNRGPSGPARLRCQQRKDSCFVDACEDGSAPATVMY